MPIHRTISQTVLGSLLVAASLSIAGCETGAGEIDPRTQMQRETADARTLEQHPATLAIDRAAQALDLAGTQAKRQDLLAQRWLAVQTAVAYHGTAHRDAFYTSRAYWHTGSSRGITWARQQPGDLDEPLFIDGKASVTIAGDVNDDIDIAGNCVVHILGDLNATLDLQGICEVIVAGDLTPNATIICAGQLELFVGGDNAGILGSTDSSTLIIDGDAAGTLQSGAPATRLTVTGDLVAEVLPPKNKDTVLTLRVDGYASTETMLDLAAAGFTRINATIGRSDAPPGLYPQDANANRPATRWVVLQQRDDESSESD